MSTKCASVVMYVALLSVRGVTFKSESSKRGVLSEVMSSSVTVIVRAVPSSWFAFWFFSWRAVLLGSLGFCFRSVSVVWYAKRKAIGLTRKHLLRLYLL